MQVLRRYFLSTFTFFYKSATKTVKDYVLREFVSLQRQCQLVAVNPAGRHIFLFFHGRTTEAGKKFFPHDLQPFCLKFPVFSSAHNIIPANGHFLSFCSAVIKKIHPTSLSVSIRRRCFWKNFPFSVKIYSKIPVNSGCGFAFLTLQSYIIIIILYFKHNCIYKL